MSKQCHSNNTIYFFANFFCKTIDLQKKTQKTTIYANMENVHNKRNVELVAFQNDPIFKKHAI